LGLLPASMAQWNGQFSGSTHDTKVEDVEFSLRQAVTAFDAALGAERESKATTVRSLAGRLLKVRLKALRAKRSALSEPGRKTASGRQIAQMHAQEQQLGTEGVAAILREFNFRETPVVPD
jgi:hypothetical protein